MTNPTALVVVSHPDTHSLNHALAETVANEWSRHGYDVTVLDLHALGFDPVLDLREARGQRTEDKMVNEHIRLLSIASALCVVHPNCWGSPPAMMKGWMDRVFAPGAAYAFAKGEDDGAEPIGLFTSKRALILNTSNTTLEREQAVFGDPLERIWRDCLLGYCGFQKIERTVFRVVATSSRGQRVAWLGQAADLARSLVAQKIG